MESKSSFGQRLKRLRLSSQFSDGSRLTQEKFAEMLFVSVDTVSHWERNITKISASDRDTLTRLVRSLFICGGIKNVEEANELLNIGLYSALSQLEIDSIWDKPVKKDNTIDDMNINQGIVNNIKGNYYEEYHENNSQTTINHYHSAATQSYNPRTTAQALISRWNLKPTDPHLDKTISGYVIHLMNVISELVSLYFPVLFISVVAWGGAAWLMYDLLLWQQWQPELRAWAALRFAIAGALTPILIALNLQANDEEKFDLSERKLIWTLRFLKVTGGLVGFLIGAGFLLATTLTMQYWLTPPSWIPFFGLSCAVFLTIVGAKRIPADRFKMYNKMQIHPADRLFFGVGLLGCSVLATITWMFYPLLVLPKYKFALLAAMAIVVLSILWQRRY